MPRPKHFWPAVFLIIGAWNAPAQFVQYGNKLVGTGSVAASQGWSVALSADGGTAAVGGPTDGFPSLGSVWFYTRAGGGWVQQGPRMTGTGVAGDSFASVNQGSSVALSADGNTAIVGGYGDNNTLGAAWIFTRTNGVWTQEGNKLTGGGALGTSQYFGSSVSISSDGNTAAIGGINDSSGVGAAWVFARNNGVWTQSGGKLVGSNAVGPSHQGGVAISGDGKTVIVGGYGDNSLTGAAWVFTNNNGTWTQQGNKLVGNGAAGVAYQGISTSLSTDGNTALVGGYGDNGGVGAAWVFTRNGGVWSQQGNKLVGSGAAGPTPVQGFSVSLSGNGNIAIVGGPLDGGSTGAFWAFARGGGVWSQVGGKLVGSGAAAANGTSHGQGHSVAISADGTTVIEGSPTDAGFTGAAWIFVQASGGGGGGGGGGGSGSGGTPSSVSPASGSTSIAPMSFVFNDSRGWQDLDVVNILINNFLDGRNACYLAYSRPGGVLYLVSDAGGGLSPGLVLGGSGSITNGQCTINSSGSSVAGTGTTLMLSLNITFSASFGGNKVTYQAARDLQGGNSGWQALGTWSVPGGPAIAPSVTGVSPARGSGSGGTFEFNFSDTKGFQDLGVLNVLINNFLDGRSACYLAYSRPGGVLYLVGDAGGGLSPGLALGGSGSIANSQCTVSSSGSSASGSGNNFKLTLNISFSAGFSGNRVVYVAARDATDVNNSGWQSMGSWSVQ